MVAACTATYLLELRLKSRPFASQWRQTRQAPAAMVVRAAASKPPPRMRSFDGPSSSSNGSTPYSSSSGMASSSGTRGGAAKAAAPPAAATPPAEAPRSYRVSAWQAMAFNGAVPERVNGRLAMMAFLYVVRKEMETGQTGKNCSLSALSCCASCCSNPRAFSC